MKEISQRRRHFNFKRGIRPCTKEDIPYLEWLLNVVSYGGNPEHKRNPGDFGLNPPSNPRPGKSLCDTVKVFKRELALKLLKEGVRRGLISDRINEYNFPQNIWSVIVMKNGERIPLESQIENPSAGVYHGYPVPPTDFKYKEILKRWKDSQCLISK